VLNLVVGGHAGVSDNFLGVIDRHDPTLLCQPPFVTNIMKDECEFPNSG
jgi:hypothetical protein